MPFGFVLVRVRVREKDTNISSHRESQATNLLRDLSAVLFQGRIVAFMRLVWVPALPGALDCERGEEHDS